MNWNRRQNDQHRIKEYYMWGYQVNDGLLFTQLILELRTEQPTQ